MKAQRAHFEEVASEYEGSIPEHIMKHLTQRRVALARSLVEEGSVLDVGCGTGRFLKAIPASYERVGVDISSAMLEQARNRGLDVFEGSAASLPFDDESFDLVTSFAVLHHLIQRELVVGALFEMARVVKPGGAVIVWDHNPLNPYWRVLMAKLPQDQGDERLVPAHEVIDALQTTKLNDIKLRRMTFTPDFTPQRFLSAISRLERMLERIPILNVLAAHNVVVAKSAG